MVKVRGPGLAVLKKKIRDSERLLKRENLPANVRVEHERAIVGLKEQLISTQTKLKEAKLLDKYRRVRFIEFKKASKRMKQVQKQLDAETDPEKRKELTLRRHKYEVDLKYIKEFPSLKKYISLYIEDTTKETKEKRTAIWKEMEQKLEKEGHTVAHDKFYEASQTTKTVEKSNDNSSSVKMEDEFLEV
ncbi:rRNA processing protein [Schizosaccharomyces japonicus yFS275]|uniref:rRNA-processing protein EFG1 n=1 Tax=Schizosaccharomyces japonicus (strain yFS275 / FY16936) TaxID=402676 RepID=B6JVZ7_SCHJY|nr:rRNA processing protein [Schizosaccharomyces japonicus yFS275]EEB05548.1 rRNA processing protein [Schizosaccharomyces japonicus yFS275]